MDPRSINFKAKEANLVTELTKKTKDKIAEIIELKCKENWLAPTVNGFIYGTTRALDYGDYWGTVDKRALWTHAVNKNFDLFNHDELMEEGTDKIPSYLTFRKASMFSNHQSHDPQLSIGLVFDAVPVTADYEDMHLVILFGIDRMKAASIARTLETYPTRVYTSMGCSIKSSMCTVCEKEIKKDSDFCDCLKYSRGRRIKGKIASELLCSPINFYEQSIVQTPACSNAQVLCAVSELIPGRILKVAAQEFGGEVDAILRITASIYQSIKTASTLQEKKALSYRLDALINKLEGMF